MPGLDRSGPMGAGPMTGGRRGTCNRVGRSDLPPVGAGYGYGRGLGMRHGRGAGFGVGPPTGRRGFGRDFGGYPSTGGTEERDLLRADVEAMGKSLDAILKRLGELEAERSQ